MGECAFGLSEVGHSDCTDATVRTASGGAGGNDGGLSYQSLFWCCGACS